jgi:hypothetical protein
LVLRIPGEGHVDAIDMATERIQVAACRIPGKLV